MELFRYAQFFVRHAVLILLTVAITAGVAAAAVAAQPDSFRASSSVLLSLRDTRNLTEYDFDQFYVLQASELYASNIVSWLNSNDVNENIRNQANATEGRLRGKKNGGTIELVATASSGDQTSSLLATANRLIGDRTRALSQGSNRASFEAVPSNLGVKTIEPNPLRAGGVGALAGLILGLAFGLLSDATRRRVRGRDDLPHAMSDHVVVRRSKRIEDGVESYRELRERLGLTSGVILVADFSKRGGQAAAGLASAFHENDQKVTIIETNEAGAAAAWLSSGRSIKTIARGKGSLTTEHAQATLPKSKGLTVINAGPARADLLIWQRYADTMTVVVDRNQTTLSDLRWLSRNVADSVTVYLG